MTMSRTRLLPGAALMAGALFLAGCGEGDFGGEAEPAPGEEADEGESAGAADECALSEPPPIDGEAVTEGASHEIDFGIGLAEDSPQYMSVEYFQQILDERTGGRLQVQIYPNSQVGDDLQMMNALQSGTLEMTFPSTSPATGIVPELQIFDLPFLFPTAEDADEVLDGEIGQEMLDAFDGTGIKALAFAENGYRQLTNSVGQMSTPDDVSGLRVRVMENPIQVDIWKALGANPTSMAFGEVFSALEQGVVDGQENPWSTILTSGFVEVQDYAVESRHVYTPFIIMMGEDFFEGLSPEDQEIVQEAAYATRDYQRTVSREFTECSKQELLDQGMEISELTDDERAAFQDATQQVYENWAPEIGPELIERVRSSIEGQ